MDIIFKAPDGVNQFMLRSDGTEYELFKKATNTDRGNGKKSKYEWLSLKRYYYTLPAGVYAALDLCLKADNDTVTVDAEKTRIALGKILRDKVDKIAEQVSTA